jgi:hypothetical protein
MLVFMKRKTVEASVAKVTTLADGGLRVSLDLPEIAVEIAAWLMEAKRVGRTVKVEIPQEDG